ncbi:MAG: amidohydrolase family protein [Acidobacteria bacterium]|nr:amidohydrolase family protein [Acidobacteriota bacterium]
MKKMTGLAVVVVIMMGSRSVHSQIPAELISYPQLILHNGKILTVDDNFSIAQAVAIRDGVILAVGSNQDLLRLQGPETKVVDLQARSVIPGLVQTDADNDFVGGNLYKETLLGGKILGTQEQLKSRADILAEVQKQAAAQPAGEMLFFRVAEEIEDSMTMTKADLDPVSPNHPLAINVTSFDMVVNSLMLEKVLAVLPGGASHPSILKDPNGQPNGQLFGFAMGVAGWDLRPWPKIDEAILQEQKDMFTRLHRRGITSMIAHMQGFGLSIVNVLYHREELTMRIFAAHDFLRQNPNAEAFLRRLGNLIDFGLGDMVQIVGAGLEAMDGDAPNGSALTLRPKVSSGGFAFGPNGHNVWTSYGPMSASIAKDQTEWNSLLVAVKYGWSSTGIHNVGDMARQVWMDGIEQGLKSPDLVLRPQFRPFGLDHNLFWTPDQYDQVKRLDMRFGLGKFQTNGAAQSMQLYGERIHNVQPVPELIRNGLGVHLEGASFSTMERYISRADDRGRLWGPDQAVDRPTALRMTTIWAARFIGEEQNLGSIEKGKKADLAVLGADFLTVPVNQISDIPVDATVVGGKVVYGNL